ncbi:MAG: ABC transporter permease [Lachnospiraceae bacterium]|nr:ABC transporter permease [Lachnospiraceae bacterium]
MNLSLLKTIKSERIKLKRSPVWLAFFVLPIISAFFGTFNYVANQGVLKKEWYSLWTQHSLFLCYLFMPALIGTYCSYLWRLEHMRNNWNSFLTAPVSRFSLYCGKLSQAVVMVLIGNAWIFLLYCLCGKITGLPGLPPKESISWFACGILGGIVICCVQLAISMVIRSFAIPIGIGLAGGIGGLVMTNKGWGLYYPYSLYCMGMRANNPNLALDTKVFVISSIIYIVTFSVVSVIGLRKHETAF